MGNSVYSALFSGYPSEIFLKECSSGVAGKTQVNAVHIH